MKKSISLLLLSTLCLYLTGCSANTGGICCGILIMLSLGVLALAAVRNHSLSKLRRSRRMNKKQRAWLRNQMVITNMLYLVAAGLLIIGIIAGVLAGLAVVQGDTKPETDPPPSAPANLPRIPPSQPRASAPGPLPRPTPACGR